jgi:hypothetical protein
LLPATTLPLLLRSRKPNKRQIRKQSKKKEEE